MARKHGSSIKDSERYEALRKEGVSKEKAARISNTPRRVAGEKGGSATAYETWTKQVGITGSYKMRKDEIIKALRSH